MRGPPFVGTQVVSTRQAQRETDSPCPVVCLYNVSQTLVHLSSPHLDPQEDPAENLADPCKQLLEKTKVPAGKSSGRTLPHLLRAELGLSLLPRPNCGLFSPLKAICHFLMFTQPAHYF
jgi:hypothetical protein